MGKFEDKTGQKFGRLSAVRFLRGSRKVRGKWECLCECGNVVFVESSQLTNGDTVSCGCRKLDHISEHFTTHGKSGDREYRSWVAMKQRCYNPNVTGYPNYGGRGITVCERWLESFQNFFEDMGECPEGMTLDRIDVNGNYEPNNCRWVGESLQKFNTRRRSDNTSGKTGVSYDKGVEKWRATISYEKMDLVLGLYKSFEDAVEAREEAEIKYYGFIKE